MERVVFREAIQGLEVEQVVRDFEYSMTTRHFHETYELYFLKEGERYYFIDKETYLVKSGDVVLIKRDQIPKTSMAGSSYHNRILLQMRSEVCNPVLRANGLLSIEEFYERSDQIISLTEGDRKTVENLLLTMKDEIHKRQKYGEQMVYLKLIELFIILSRYKKSTAFVKENQKARTAKYQKVHEVADYLLSCPETKEGLEELAKRFYISKSYLTRIFREVTGFTVNEYMNVARIKKAQNLLIHSGYSITEIAEILGFESITYFERVFKKYTDDTPLKYKKRMKNS